MDLIRPGSADELPTTLRDASAAGTKISIVGSRSHLGKGGSCEVDAELETTALDRVIAYDPAEMLAVVESGVTIRDLRSVLAEGNQEWPVDGADGTVGGAIATAVTSPRRLRLGLLRDTVVEMDLVTGDGRRVRSGARTVKSVQGFDVHRLLTGSLGTLGAITRVALKVRPLPRARRLIVASAAGLEAGRTLLDAVPLASGIVATPARVEAAIEGWPDEVEEQTEAARRAIGDLEVLDGERLAGAEAIASALVAEVAVVPSALDAVLAGEPDWRALIGVGIAWVGLPDDDARLGDLRRRVAEAGGIAPVIRGPGGLGDAPVPALDVHRRLKAAFDPAGILAPGRFWGGL